MRNVVNSLLVENHLKNEQISDKLDFIKALETNKIHQILLQQQYSFEFPFDTINEFSIFEIIDYLKLTHSYYLYKKLPEIDLSILNLKKHHYETNAFLVLLTGYFLDFKEKLCKHIEFEEKILFPYINQLGKNQTKEKDDFNLKYFIENHPDTEKELEKIRLKIMEFTKDTKTPFAFNIFMNQLHLFEIDLYRHAMVEDLILIPKGLELEKMTKRENLLN
jgi:regulator of cell morphogenesis and NO signaling